MRFVIVTGVSGAGKSTVLKMLEDAHYFCVDNLPIPLVEKFASLMLEVQEEGVQNAALGIDARSGRSLEELTLVLDHMKKYHIPASITIAQAGLESNWGRSRLANKYNNLFGIKANSDDEKVQMYTTENIRGKNVQVKQYFTVYNSWADSINAHTLLIVNGTVDNHARFHGVQTAKTYQQAAYELQRNGYATDPDYASKLIYAIKKFNLAQYDNVK